MTGTLLRDSFYLLKREAAPGMDRVTWREYEQGLEGRIADLHGRVHRGSYRAQPSRRVYIPKLDGRQRPLGIAALEDKIVQQAVVTVLNQIYEEDFRQHRPCQVGGAGGTEDSGSEDTAADPEMAEGRSVGRRETAGNEGRDSARSGFESEYHDKIHSLVCCSVKLLPHSTVATC